MSSDSNLQLADNTPILVGTGQYTEQLPANGEPALALTPPVELAARAAADAVTSTGGHFSAADIETIATIRLFSDSAPVWSCPFGRSDNPPESIARRIGASPRERIYSDAGGTQPLQLLAEFSGAIARGELQCALLTGMEAMASQRYAQRNGLEPDWSEHFDPPLDSRDAVTQMVSPAELNSGLYLPAHWYALIENLRAHQRGNSVAVHKVQMAELLAPFNDVARSNPYAYFQNRYSAADLASEANGNYPICVPYNKLLVARDAVNQAAAVVLTSAGKARELGIPADNWILQLGYADGEDQYLPQRQNPGTSVAMEKVLRACFERAGLGQADMDLIDIYSCFPCAIEAARDALGMAATDPRPLTVTGGLPFFGGPGNEYSLHALAEMVMRLRATTSHALVTANGGMLSKHAALVLASNSPALRRRPLDYATLEPTVIGREDIEAVPLCTAPARGTVLSYTQIFERQRDDVAIILGETARGERFLAHSTEPDTLQQVLAQSPVGRDVQVEQVQGRHRFRFGY
ncbi:acetyl-CoA acetyltransferase [Seongchinamella unica]|uniref:Acetyl-CoA acetyltransferase n=1 Tax=Seongchinamella unica TaxID=2547392 RepID=A0A4V6PIY3_9GAMM|nr:acetyl-CoA acetyltransferase [Seongchinamella unica]TDG14845.1 acetyl-CoA acetyltransferase [Seongchinamella unica]